MCGIVGIFDQRGQRPIDRDLLRRMNDSQSHRGPDETGLFVGPGVGLGHRRLSIIDLSSGQQPMYNDDNSVVIVYNGEVYNYQALATELRAMGYTFKTNCDTEVILRGYEAWGEKCVERLRGMFAFAIWDQRNETLFLARDRLGIKPVYYAHLADGTVLFGSELKSILPYPDLPRTIDLRAVEDYFAYGYIPDPKSIFQHVHKLAPGHVISFKRGAPAPSPRQYWDVNFNNVQPMDEGEVGEELIRRLREAVGIRMIADVPLGAFLSGGVDSSAVVALMAEQSDKPVDTCSISFDHKTFDESQYAAMVAEKFATSHRVKKVDPDSYDLIDQLTSFYDEPFADSSAMPTFRVCALAREKVTVALSGDGGDEVFAGYRRYRWHHYEENVRSILPHGIRGPLFGFLGTAYPKLDWAPKFLRAKSTFQALGRDSEEGYFHSVSVINDTLRRRLYSERTQRDLQGYHANEVLRGFMRNAPTDNHIARAQYADLKTYLPGDILTKVDRASMATSLEVRVPILDHEFIEWSATVPANLKLRDGEGKYVFKKALEKMLPHDLLYRPKMGFAVPLTHWFRGPLKQRVRDAVTGPVLAESGLFNQKYLETLVNQHQSGVNDHSPALWALVMFESFLRETEGSFEHDREPDRLRA
ncbi:MAG: amidotransferase 1, exosortase A system-associated [Hyphomicrobiales bacterium]|nr:amidotransferase 1, exosortase A system-associated [Hyphomicrobiales bacterium]MCP5373670.1 amidotransferase 1, exosortase A system-associated [Hyphomicrobiales bacterium]